MATSKSPPREKEKSTSPETLVSDPQAGTAVTNTAPSEVVETIPPGQAGSDDDDADSGLDAESIISTESLTESILDYRRLHGRSYASKTEYWAPNDDLQNEGLDILHHVMLMMFDDQLYSAPIGNNPQRILDVGTGTGIWCMDMADQFPGAEVTGTDISPIQPAWVPPNCKFVLDDLTLEWTWPADHFDFIHLRGMYGSVSDWEALYRNVFEHLQPGGWFEDVEMDVKIESDHVNIPKDHIFNQWAELFYEGGEKMGRPFTIAQGHFMKDLMAKIGFVDIYERKIKVPLHGWPKDLRLREAGRLAQLALDGSLEGFGTFLLTEVHGWDYAEAILFVAQMRKETRKLTNYPWYITTLVYGRKPHEG